MIFYHSDYRTFYLESLNTTYAFRINEYGYLQHLYFGKRIARDNLAFSIYEVDRGHGTHLPNSKKEHSLGVIQNECPVYGRSDYRESMIALDFNGVRVGDFLFERYEILDYKPTLENMPSCKGKQTLVVYLYDSLHKVKIVLHYTVYEDLPVILRHAEIINESDRMVKIDRAYSFALDLPDCNWQVMSLYGAHLRERFVQRTDLSYGILSVDSKRGESSGQMNPFMALVRKNTDENQGVAIGVNLIYSGNFVFKAEVEQNDGVRLLGGINDYDFCWHLLPASKFVTPEVSLVFSDEGLGKMSRAFHDLYRDYLINENYSKSPRPIVINNWEATYFDFDTEKLCAIVDSICETGIDTFVLDDGWFGTRNNDKEGLGDWFVNENKVDLKKLIDYTHKKGLKFGLWFEPEMVSPNSDLYRNHPDYVLHVEGLEPCLGRDQLVLDLTRQDVRDHIVSSVCNILDSYAIDYVKWDMNRTHTENYSPSLGVYGKETSHRYVLGLYDICDRIINTHQHIFFEGCASGGCRFDPGMLYYFPQIWTSDDSDCFMRTLIQYGTSLCYPLSSMSCHVSVSPNHQCGRVTPFKSRADIAHLGATGYELDTTKLDYKDIEAIKTQVLEYKKMENLVLEGDLYRLNNPFNENLFAEAIVSKDKTSAIVTVFRPLNIPNSKANRVYLKGLDSSAQYFIKELNIVASGSALENLGIIAEFPNGDFQSFVCHLRKVD
jgi:alpha-galactosidase